MASSLESEVDIAALEGMADEELLRWAFSTYGDRAAIGTSLQLTGSVLIDMAARMGLPFRVFILDTLRLHPESYLLIEKFEKRYGIAIERFTPEPKKLEKMLNAHGEYLFFDSKEKQEYCCHIRKVEPNERALETLDTWITGLRRDQSDDRREISRVSWMTSKGRSVLKLAPLAHWTEADIKKYISDHDVPYHPLFDQGYDSIGCMICSTPLRPGEPKRAGRWRWFNASDTNKECGIHLDKGEGI